MPKFFPKVPSKAEALAFIHYEASAGLLNLWNSAAQTVIEQLLSRSLLGCLLNPVWWPLELGVGVKISR